MNINIEKSFTAKLRMIDHDVNALEVLYGEPIMVTVTLFSGGFFTGAPQTSDHSSLLGMRPKGQGKTIESLKLHFGHTDDGYIISIKNKGIYHNKIICTGALDLLGAKDPDTTDPTIFTLTDHRNNAITLDHICAPHLPISIKSGEKKYVGGSKVRGSHYIYLSETGEQSKVTFALSILKKGVALNS